MEERTNDDGILAGTSPRIKRCQVYNVDELETTSDDDLDVLESTADMSLDESTITFASTDVNTCVICERRFKGARGVRIHL